MKLTRLLIVIAVLAACGALISFGNIEREVSLDSVGEMWSDILRDADRTGLKAARVSIEDETRMGNEMAAALATRWVEDPKDTAYVTSVGNRLAPHLRRKGMRYTFHVLESPQINAFALPGGQIYVFRGMMNFLTTEAELAAVIGHEMSHVDLRHCIERRGYESALRRVGAGGVGQVVDTIRQVVAIGYSQAQELEADAQGIRLSIEAGYDPDAGQQMFTRLDSVVGHVASPPPNTPAGEIGQSVESALSGYFQSHPRSSKRSQRLAELVSKNHARFAGRSFYRGAHNYTNRIPRSQSELPNEWIRF